MRENRFSREREWEARRSYYAEARTRKSKINNNWDSFSTTFFFCNFPFSCESSDLWRAFERLGTVLDVYISKKLTMKGSRFGFVRFKIDRDANRIEEGLNNTWFGSYRLRANVSKYDSKGSSRDTKTKQNEFRKKVMAAPSNNIEEGKLFTDALLNKGGRSYKGPLEEGSKKNSKRQTSVQISSNSMEAFSPPVLMLKETESAWLANCLVGELKHLMSIKNLESLLEKENIRAGAVRFIGGNKILIDCSSKENKDCVFGNFEWWSVLFKWIVPWSLDFNTVGRVVKIKCYGVPLQAWCKETFFDIGSLWGDVIEIADETLDKSNLEMGMVTILTKHWETISNDIKVSLNNTLYNIRISEMVDAFKHQDWKSEEADSSLEDSSSEDYYSDSVAEHYLNGDDSGCSGEEDDRSVNSVQSINDKVNLEKNEVTLGQQISAASSKSTKKESSSKGDASLNDRYPIMGQNDDVDPFSTSRANGPAGDEAQSTNGPHDISNIPETTNSAHSANQVTVNISETLMDKLENISFSVNGIKERGFKSLAEIIENLDSNNLHMNFDNKKVKGKKNKDRKKKAVRVKGISQNEGISNYSNSNKFEKKSCSIDSELERREIEKETKLGDFNDRRAQFLWGVREVEYQHSGLNGAFDGIVCLWVKNINKSGSLGGVGFMDASGEGMELLVFVNHWLYRLELYGYCWDVVI